jgi:hypothetical protein
METQNNHYQNPALEATMNTSFLKIKELVKISAESFGARNLPELINDRMGSYWSEFHPMFQGILDDLNKTLQFQSTCQAVLSHEQTADQKKRSAHNALIELQNDRIPIDDKLKNTPVPTSRKRYRRAQVIVAVICFAEGLYSSQCFESWGYNYIASLGMGIGLAFVLAGVAWVFPKLVGLCKNKWQTRLLIVTSIIISGIFFKFLADARIDFLTSGGSDMSIQYSPWPFVCMSELLLITATCLHFFALPTDAQKKQLEEYEKLIEDKQKNKRDIEAMVEKIVSIDEDHKAMKTLSGSTLVYGSMLEERIITEANGAYFLFKKFNLLSRSNGKPQCQDDPYPFPFKTYFDSIKQLLPTHASTI